MRDPSNYWSETGFKGTVMNRGLTILKWKEGILDVFVCQDSPELGSEGTAVYWIDAIMNVF